MTGHGCLLHDVVTARVLSESMLVFEQVLLIGEGSPLVIDHLLVTLVAATTGRWFVSTVSIEILVFVE